MNHRHDISALTTSLVLLTMLCALPATAAQPDNRADANNFVAPRLIVGITVDQLRSDYLNALKNKLSQGGFRRLMQEGVVYDNVTFDLDNPDATATMATLATGSYPYHHGIPAQLIFDLQTLQRHSVFQDRDYAGTETAGNWSPRALLSSTLGDELKLASQLRSKVYSIAPNPEQALIGAGHAANSAVWFDEKTGHWASTTFYHEFPVSAVRQNMMSDEVLFYSNLNKYVWTATGNSSGADAIAPYLQTPQAFNHKFSERGKVNYAWIKTSPIINEAISKMAQQYILNSHMGLAGSTDMLQLTFYAGTYQHENLETYPAELQDIYLQLDRTLEHLLQYIDKAVGLQNTFIYLMGTGATDSNVSDVPGISTGEFNANRCTALLNSHLISLYGQGQWVDGFNDGQIYLNHKTIEQRGLQLDDVARKSAELVSLFSGIEEVYTQQQLLHQDYSQRITRIRNGYDKRTGGDLVIILQPGWKLRLSDRIQPQSQVRHDIYPGPAILFAPAFFTPERITAPVDATAIAPTVAKAIRIRAPSACRTLPIR